MDELHRCNNEEVERVTREMLDEDLDEVYSFLMGPHLKRLEIARKENIIAELRSCRDCKNYKMCMDRSRDYPCSLFEEKGHKMGEQKMKGDLIKEISERSGRYGDKLIEFMDRYGLDCLRDATSEQLQEYLEIIQD